MTRRPLRTGLTIVALIGVATPGLARDTLGVFRGWAAFRDPGPVCFAIAEPAGPGAGPLRPSAAIGYWPKRGIARQLHLRLSRPMRSGARITLGIGDANFTLAGSGADAWAPDAIADARIVAAMRSGSSMSVATVAASGGGFADVYLLRGAASAIDAAALGCMGGR